MGKQKNAPLAVMRRGTHTARNALRVSDYFK